MTTQPPDRPPGLVPLPDVSHLPPTIGASQAAALLGIQPETASELARQGWLGAIAVGRTYRFSTNAILRFLAGDQVVPEVTIEMTEPSLLRKYTPNRIAS